MANIVERLRLNPERPQMRQIQRAVTLMHDGIPVVVPTESCYALMALPTAHNAQAMIRKIRFLDDSHLWSLVCPDLSVAAKYVRIDNQAHRLLRHHLPGAFTFILPASSNLPKRVFGKRRDVGIRIPNHPVCSMLMQLADSPLLATTMQFADEQTPASDPDQMMIKLKGKSFAILDSGWGGTVPTTVVDLCHDEPTLLRAGLGEWE
ncbi:MAG: L-threonylcarbamoyladenylate synthase [Mariprofundaceae bacterium]